MGRLWRPAWCSRIDDTSRLASARSHGDSAVAVCCTVANTDHRGGGGQFPGCMVCDFAASTDDAVELCGVSPSCQRRRCSRRESVDGWQLGFRSLRDADPLLWRAACCALLGRHLALAPNRALPALADCCCAAESCGSVAVYGTCSEHDHLL